MRAIEQSFWIMQIVTSIVRIDVALTLSRSALVARRRSLGAIASKQIFCSRGIQARVTPLWVRAYKTTVSNDVVKACRQSYRLRQSQLCTHRCSIRCGATRKHNIAGMHQLWNTYVYEEVLQAVVAGVEESVHGADSAENQSGSRLNPTRRTGLDPSRV